MPTEPRVSKSRRKHRRKGKMSEVASCCPIVVADLNVAGTAIIGEAETLSITETQVPARESQDADAPDIIIAATQKSAADEANYGKPLQIVEVGTPKVDASKDACAVQNLKDDNNVLAANQKLPNSEIPLADSESPTVISNVNEKNELSKIESTNKKNEANTKQMAAMSKLEQELQNRTQERDAYRKKFEETEKKLASLQICYDSLMSNGSDEATLRQTVEQLKSKLIQTSLKLEERGRVVANQENQINALNNQVASLKEVVAITRDLLQIRNTEVKHLQEEVNDMESRISEERTRHNTMLSKMEAAVRLNADLKKEYETQLRLFQDLRGKYEEKVTLLSEEKQALESAAQSAAQ